MIPIIFLILFFSAMATWIGIAQAQRFGGTYFAFSMILLLASVLSGVGLAVLLYFYSDNIAEDVGVPWIENLGIALGGFMVAFLLASVFTLIAKVIFALVPHKSHNSTDA